MAEKERIYLPGGGKLADWGSLPLPGATCLPLPACLTLLGAP
ncbi:MAG: hypothetical protein ACR2K1_00805 [Saprospiraceae bacterium]